MTSPLQSPGNACTPSPTISHTMLQAPVMSSSSVNLEQLMDSKLNAMFSRVEKLVKNEVASLKTHIESKLQEKFVELQSYVDGEIARVSGRVQSLEETTKQLVDEKEEANIFDPMTTVVAENMPFEDGEDLASKVSNMLRRDMSVHVPVLRTTRLDARPPRNTRYGSVSKPGLVKIQFSSVADKVSVLREKQKLRNSPDFSNVYLRSSKSHTDRITEQNLKTILELIPEGKDYRITGNGRLVKRENNTNASSQVQE